MKELLKKSAAIFAAFVLAAGLFACSSGSSAVTSSTAAGTESQATEALETGTQESSESAYPEELGTPVATIVYTNDIHAFVANTVTEKDENGNSVEKTGLRLSKIAQMVKDLRSDGENVILIDVGDEIQGCSYGAIDEGESVIGIMNQAGYQLAVPGNHDFDFTVDRFLEVTEEADFPYISCNFMSLEEKSTVLEPYKIMEVGDVKIAFIGMTAPDTITTSTPEFFKDLSGKFTYYFEGLINPKVLYESVQKNIDEVKSEADYIIAAGHLGVGTRAIEECMSSKDVIEHVEGLDAFIDGHSHTVMEGEAVQDKSGNDVLLTQTGAYLKSVGVMRIYEDGTITTELVEDYDSSDPETEKLEEELIDKIDEKLGQKIAVLDTKLYTHNPEDETQRLIRSMEMNAGDFVADAYYWYLNQYTDAGCDITLQNGGGIRTFIDAGDVTKKSIKDVLPFENMICLVSATGQQIKDALEMGVSLAESWDGEDSAISEFGSFMHVAGLKYEVDTSIPSSVETDENGFFKSVNGQYRVHDVEVYNRETGEYEPLDLNESYNLGGIDYTLMESGDGFTMFADCIPVTEYVGLDSDVVETYINAFETENDYPRINTENSPLSEWDGYLIDYEEPFGAGRIVIE